MTPRFAPSASTHECLAGKLQDCPGGHTANIPGLFTGQLRRGRLTSSVKLDRHHGNKFEVSQRFLLLGLSPGSGRSDDFEVSPPATKPSRPAAGRSYRTALRVRSGQTPDQPRRGAEAPGQARRRDLPARSHSIRRICSVSTTRKRPARQGRPAGSDSGLCRSHPARSGLCRGLGASRSADESQAIWTALARISPRSCTSDIRQCWIGRVRKVNFRRGSFIAQNPRLMVLRAYQGLST